MEFDGSFNKKEIFMVGICCFLLGICLMISIQSQHISSNMSPQDWVKDKDISVYDNHVCFNATNLSWAGYKDTNSMLPTFDGTANGIVMDLCWDKKLKKLNLELVKVIDKYKNIHYEVRFEDWTKIKTKTLFKLHIKDAIDLKSMIDNFVIDIQEDMIKRKVIKNEIYL